MNSMPNFDAWNMLIRILLYMHQHNLGGLHLRNIRCKHFESFSWKGFKWIISFQSFVFLNYIWIGPLSTSVVCYLIWLEVGISAVPSYVLMLIWIVIPCFFGQLSGAMRSVSYFIYSYFIIISIFNHQLRFNLKMIKLKPLNRFALIRCS